jgi:hypothetical protein
MKFLGSVGYVIMSRNVREKMDGGIVTFLNSATQYLVMVDITGIMSSSRILGSIEILGPICPMLNLACIFPRKLQILGKLLGKTRILAISDVEMIQSGTTRMTHSGKKPTGLMQMSLITPN